jgi:hypothetical protein
VSFEALENFDLTFHFAFLDWLEGLDNYVFIIDCRYSRIDFGVLALTDFGDDLEFIDIPDNSKRVTHTRFRRFNSYNSSIPFSY